MTVEVHKNDVGTILELELKDDGVVVNISSQTSLKIFLRKPDGVVLEKTAALSSDGADGKMRYVVIDELDQTGMWEMQGEVTLTSPAGTWRTSAFEFRVYENL